MSKQEIEIMDQMTEALNQNMDQIYAGLAGRELCAETLAESMLPLCPGIPAQELEADCRSLLDGIRSGAEYAQNLLEMPEEELAKVFPEQVRNALEQMDPEQQHQYLIMLYQYLSQSVDKQITRDEAVMIANTSNEELFRKICDLGAYAQAEITSQAADVFHETLQQAANRPLPEGAAQYTQEERMWVLAAATYAQSRESNPEKIPATMIGEVIGLSGSSAQAFRKCLLDRIIPAAVGVLAVAAVGTLVYFGVKALMGWSLFASVLNWMTAQVSPVVLYSVGAASLLEPVGMIAADIYQTAYTATAAFTARFHRDEAREQYYQNQPVLMPGEGIVNVDETTQVGENYPAEVIKVPEEYEGNGYIREENDVRTGDTTEVENF